jgi:predicted ribosomally synthesized peptide with SipW-like signal peptide
MPEISPAKKILLSLGALGAAGAIAGLGTFATFTSTTSATEQVTAGKVAIALGASGAANRLSVSATRLVAGDTIQRAVDLISTSTDPLATVKLITTATTSSVLDTNTTDGLQMHIQRCSLATGWVEAGLSPAYTYTCPLGTVTDVLASGSDIITTTAGGVSLTNLAATTTADGVTDHLLLTVTLPSSNTDANLATPPSSTIQYSFTGTQRAATDR